MAITYAGNVGIAYTAPGYTLQVNGSAAGSGAWINLSDRRLKKNVAPINDALGLVQRLQGVRFKWRSSSERQIGKSLKLPVDEPQIGLIAQDVEKVLPEAVAVSNKGAEAIYGVKEGDLVPVLVEAIKQQQAEIKAQKAEIDDLRATVSAALTALKAKKTTAKVH